MRRLLRSEHRCGVMQTHGIDLHRGGRLAARSNCQRLERVDVHLRWGQHCLWRAVGKARGMQGECDVERFLPNGMHGGHSFEEDLCRREEREPGVMMVVVVPPEELLEPRPGVVDR